MPLQSSPITLPTTSLQDGWADELRHLQRKNNLADLNNQFCRIGGWIAALLQAKVIDETGFNTLNAERDRIYEDVSARLNLIANLGSHH